MKKIHREGIRKTTPKRASAGAISSSVDGRKESISGVMSRVRLQVGLFRDEGLVLADCGQSYRKVD
jgi:hypothetical protein